MGTRSRIGYVNTNGEIISCYCHWDGYPSHNGAILLDYYNTFDLVKKLVDEGDMSSLAPSCEKPDMSLPYVNEKYTIYYGRDRGEDNVDAISANDKSDLINQTKRCGGEYIYLFENGKWHYMYINSMFGELTAESCKE